MLLALLIEAGEWVRVELTGDRCLYPPSLSVYLDDVCVRSARHHALCLPHLSEEMRELPPSSDESVAHFRALSWICKVMLCLALARLPLAAHRTQSAVGLVKVLHIFSAAAMLIALFGWVFAPTATGNATRWTEIVLTCDCHISFSTATSLCVVGAVVELATTVLVSQYEEAILFAADGKSRVTEAQKQKFREEAAAATTQATSESLWHAE